MAPVASTIASHLEGVSDATRARELYKYYQPTPEETQETNLPVEIEDGVSTTGRPLLLPPNRDLNVKANVIVSKVCSPDTALTAFCQLVTWRTGAQRAMISVIDSSNQYFIAESTKTLDLKDPTRHAPGDDLWMGCSTVTKAGRLCERTIATNPTAEGDYPSFVVNDLSKDPVFCQLPFVSGPPFLKFYAGVPLITKRGIPIGSLFIVDDGVWPNGLDRETINFMGTMATTIMAHMEMSREVEEHRRGMKMSRGLASFVEGRSQLVEDEADEDDEGSKVVGQFDSDMYDSESGRRTRKGSFGTSRHSNKGSVSSLEVKERKTEYSAALMKTEQAIQVLQDSHIPQDTRPSLEQKSNPASFEGTSVELSSPQVAHLSHDDIPVDVEVDNPMRTLFSRASNLIREAFEVDGGAVFYDAQRGFGDLQAKQSNRKLAQEESQDSAANDTDGSLPPTKLMDSPNLGAGSSSRSANESKKQVEMLGFSTAQASSLHGEDYPGAHSFVPFDEKSLHTLLARYPRGKLWTFDSDGSVSSSSEEELLRKLKKDPAKQAKKLLMGRKRNERAKSDARFLLRHFPGVRQLLFVPLWDAGRSRWLSACCVWTTEPTRILSKQSELAFLSAFGNSVMAECSRIDTEIADQKKGDFIGSISHELRSPLHGILASAEFLGEETLSGFERGLVETIDSCGRTLLDTINHVLDFSKISNFEKNWRKTKRSARPIPKSGAGGVPDLPMINLFAEVDISIVCEEVIESVFAGHVFQNITASSFDMVPDARGKMADSRSFLANSTVNTDQANDVVVILDCDIQNYHFTTQPGAFRRVIMNLLGNALKYTSHGYVKVTLEAKEIEDLPSSGTTDSVPRSLVTISVLDTGKGISGDFLRTKLFTPFAQENSLSSGTGLGLSIVRSIVNLLEGEITIDSEVGRGTQIKVTLPLLRDMPKSSGASSTPRSIISMPHESDDIEKLRGMLIGQKVALSGFDLDSSDEVLQQMGILLKQSITTFLTKWYGLEIVPLDQKASIIIANEADPSTVEKLEQQTSLNGKVPIILVLCSHSSRFTRSHSDVDNASVGFIAKPVGPLKLARALLQCLQGAPPLPTPGKSDPSSAGPESNDLTKLFDDLTFSPHGGEMLDNSRIAADSINARKAIESPTPNATEGKHQEFPFPVEDRPVLSSPVSMPGDKESLKAAGKSGGRQRAASLLLADMENPKLRPSASTATTKATRQTPAAAATSQPSVTSPKSPTLLLVDDNKINLTLLRTYMRKRKYPLVDEAENGLEAVNKFDGRDEGYDIIFMDISMPVLDGFGATREIRTLEARRRAALPPGAQARTPALVIALTGLASSRDQSEAFSSGVDLFLTKPVSFKEVGKLLDNWGANRERDAKIEAAK